MGVDDGAFLRPVKLHLWSGALVREGEPGVWAGVFHCWGLGAAAMTALAARSSVVFPIGSGGCDLYGSQGGMGSEILGLESIGAGGFELRVGLGASIEGWAQGRWVWRLSTVVVGLLGGEGVREIVGRVQWRQQLVRNECGAGGPGWAISELGGGEFEALADLGRDVVALD